MFFVFRDSNVITIWVMNILCTFHIFMYGYVTLGLSFYMNGFGIKLSSKIIMTLKKNLSIYLSIFPASDILFSFKSLGQHQTKQQLYGHLPHLKNHLIKTNKTGPTLLEMQTRTHKWRSSMLPDTWTGQCLSASKNKHKLCVDAGCSLEDLQGAMEDPIYPTTPLGQDMTRSQFFKRSLIGLNSEFSFS